ncbi:MAG TPA: PKD domain-containing protein [Candidatus Polarisedimenticolaceae bacterium]|nr:PKD domain-containing protein [Candidatus Polarisedimenticolaceae bacterium]
MKSTGRPNRLPMFVLSLLLGSTAVPAVVRAPSRFLPGDSAIAAASKDQGSVFLSQGGSTVLAVWADNRANSTGGYVGETSWDVYGMRFDANGNAIDVVPFPIATGPASQTVPRAAWNGTSWLVVFQSVDFGGTGYFQDSLEALRVAPDGHVIDPRPIKIYNDTPTGSTWAVASDGSGWVVVNQGTSVTGDLVASRISSLGVLLDPGPKSVLKGTYYARGSIRLAFASGVFLLAYEESMTGYDPSNAVRFDSGLQVLDAAPFALAPAPIAALSSNGTQFYAIWNEQRPDFTMAVKGTRVSSGGQRLDGSGDDISGPNQPIYDTTTSVTWDGANWRATWGTTGGTRVAKVSTAGQVLDPGGVLVATVKTGPTASAGNGSVQLAWSELVNADQNSDVFAQRIDPSNAAGPRKTVSVGAPAQLRVDLATNGSGTMMVYRSTTSSQARILAQALDAAGNPITPEPVELATGNGTDNPGYPAVAWSGSAYLVAWSDASGIVARRIQPNGTPIDAARLVMSPGFGPVDVEGLGGDVLVVGLRCGINCQYVFPIAARVRGSDGVVLDPSPIVMGGTFCSNVRLATLGGRWLLVWQANATHDECIANTLGTFIAVSGSKVPDFNVHGPYSSCGGNGIFNIGLASSGSVALMVQSQELTSGWETDLLGRLIDASGVVSPSVNLTPWRDDQYRPRIAWDGSEFVLVFQDQKTTIGGFWSLEQIDARSDLVGMRISTAGVPIDPQGFVFANGPAGKAYPNVVGSAGTALIAGSIVRNTSPIMSYRVGYEVFGAGGNRWPVAVASATPADGDVPTTLSFSSAGSGDPDGAIVSYAWDFGDGGTSTAPHPTHDYTVGGPHVATLTVTDNGAAQSTQEVLVSVLEPNEPPIAVSSSNITSGPTPLDVVLHADGTFDPDGFVGNLHWDLGDGNESWGATAYHTYEASGTYRVTLTAFDGRDGAGSAAPLTITVGPPLPPAAPSALSAIAFTPDWINLGWTDNANNEDGFKVERCPGTTAYCNGTPSAWAPIAQTGRNENYYGDTGLPSSATFSYRVRAFNVTADSAYSNVSTAATPSAPPVASNVPSVLGGAAPLAVTFDGRGSVDPDGAIVSWTWSFGDGATGSGSLASHTYASTGYFYPSLTVTDDSGATGTAYATVHVVEGGIESGTSGDAATALGAIFSGSYLDTRTENDVAEVLTEVASSGTPSTRKSQLEHTWALTIASGGMQVFSVAAWHTPNAEGDDFVFEYSRDNASWTPMIIVTKTADDDALQTYAFGSSVTGPLWVRVRDLDRTGGRAQLDRIHIDHMFVASSYSTGRSGEVGTGGALVGEPLTLAKASGVEIALSWGGSCLATDTDYSVYQGTMGSFQSHVPMLCSTSGQTTATITPSDGSAYFLVTPNDTYYEGRYGARSSGEIPAGPSRCFPKAATTGCP